MVEGSVTMGFKITVILIIACRYSLEHLVTFEVCDVSIYLFSPISGSSDHIMYFLQCCSVLYMSFEIQKCYHLQFYL